MSGFAQGQEDTIGLVGEHVIGVHHVGIPVRSLERSLDWYRELFGMEPDFVELAQGPDTGRIVQLDGARVRFAFIQLANVLVEFLEYEQPIGRDFDRRNCDVGAIHLCFEVDDIDRVYRLLGERGIEFSTEPLEQTGAIAGHRLCYFRDPDGIQLEIWQRPQ